ncbi:hypothetical protein FMM05_20385 [Flavobacterium zepuense]|uniref:Uncharacterized protein n=1 Tax=Flavobacterium zepuense TaxID=2593302 RepID=A0A552UT91_9FLAO|nr:hypothetical protein [Flavobacterium zepuense]TRW21436.1 hypothetical protein FMM05_20385 [Flavobacterium zepuense]
MKINDHEKNSFYLMVDSLKKSRRADLSDINNDDDIIEELYVDPLDGEFVLKSCLRPNTTMLIGRKGTGKSTIIARLQHEYRKDNDKLSLYIDVKTIFEQSKNFTYDSGPYRNLMTNVDLEKYLIYKTFLKQIIDQIKSEVKTNTIKFFLANISKLFGPNKKTYEIELDNIFDEIEKNEYIDIQILKEKNVSQEAQNNIEKRTENTSGLNLNINQNPSIDFSAKQTNSSQQTSNSSMEEKYSEILLKCFNPTVILNNIKVLLNKIGIKYVVICLDDFSEIEERAMKVFVDTIVSPLNNWSDEYFKFKIAAYPGRIYLGDIDPQKIEQIRLDYYDLYQSRKVTDIQAEAQKSVKKLLTTRISYFCHQLPEYFFDTSKNPIEDYYKMLFDITASVPRNVGWILWYSYQNSIAKDERISLRDLELASEKYFSDSINPYFSQNKFMREPFSIKLEKYHLKELLQSVIAASKSNKREIPNLESKIFQLDKEKPPTSHFYIDNKFEDIISSLELNFFITKYNEQKDQDSQNLMSFFTLNYGLCMKEDIFYGRGSDRKYVIQRRFNYTEIIKKYISNAKQIRCQNAECSHIFSYETLNSLQLFNMLCPICRKGNCEIEHVSVEIPNVDESIQIPEFDISLLNSLNIEEPQYPSSLAQELDCTYQKVSKRSIKLRDLGLLDSEKKTIDQKIGERRYYTLTDRARETYFKEIN